MYQEITIVGRLTRDPEIREVGNDTVCNFGVAVNKKWTDANGQEQEKVTFFNCSVWGAQARAMHTYKRKGDPVLCTGEMEFRKENENDPNTRIFSNLRAFRVIFLPSGSRNGQQGSVTQTVTQPVQPDVIPF